MEILCTPYCLQGDVAAACGAECFTGITGEKSRAIEILPKGGDSLNPRGKAPFESMIFPKLPQVRIYVSFSGGYNSCTSG